MRGFRTYQDMFKRYRRPGDFFISALTFLFALFLVVSLPFQTEWVAGTKLFAQPAFWPGVAVIAMVVFSGMHLVGALMSPREPGRFREVLYWIKALEYVVWFMAYVALVPKLGYLPATVLFTTALTLRLGYRGWRWIAVAAIFSVVVVITFRGFLHVKIPAGAIYEFLPAGYLRTFLLSYL